MELTARKRLILSHASRKVSKIINNTSLTSEQVDKELEVTEKSLGALFGADGAKDIMDGIIESVEQQDAMSSMNSSILSSAISDIAKEEIIKRRQAQEKETKEA